MLFYRFITGYYRLSLDYTVSWYRFTRHS